jgi:hypothetical protein
MSEIVKLLRAVYFAVNSGQAETFALLLERGADATAALTPAAWKPEPVFVGIALRHGARVNEADDDGRPLLNNLIRWGDSSGRPTGC